LPTCSNTNQADTTLAPPSWTRSTRTGRLTSIPYSLETNDLTAHTVQLMTPRRYAEGVRRQFHRLYPEGAHSGTVICIPLHPYLIAQYFDTHYPNTHYRDAFVAAGQAIAEVP